MIVEAPLRAGLGIATRPDTDIHGIDYLPVREGMTSEQGAQGGRGDGAVDERSVEAAPAATMQRFETEVDRRGNGISAQEGISQFEQGIGPALETGVKCGTEVLDGGEGR